MINKITRDELEHILTQGFEIIDDKSRKIRIKKPNFIAPLKLIDALGKSADNQAYYNMVEPLLWVSSIDSQPFHTGSTKMEVEAAYERLGEAGINALNKAIFEKLSLVIEDKNADENNQGELEQIKK